MHVQCADSEAVDKNLIVTLHVISDISVHKLSAPIQSIKMSKVIELQGKQAIMHYFAYSGLIA